MSEPDSFSIRSTILSFIKKYNRWIKKLFFGYVFAYIVILEVSVIISKVTIIKIVAFLLSIIVSAVLFHIVIKYGLRYDPNLGRKYITFCPDFFEDRVIALLIMLSTILIIGIIPMFITGESLTSGLRNIIIFCTTLISANFLIYLVFKRRINSIAELRIIDDITCREICEVFRLVHPFTMLPSIFFVKAYYEFILNIKKIDRVLIKLSYYDEKLSKAYKKLSERMRIDILKNRLDENKIKETFEGTKTKKVFAYIMFVFFLSGLVGLLYYLLFVKTSSGVGAIISAILSLASVIIIMLAFSSIEKAKKRLDEYIESLGVYIDEKTKIEIFDILVDIIDGILRILKTKLGIEVMIADTLPKHIEAYRRMSRKLRIQYAIQ